MYEAELDQTQFFMERPLDESPVDFTDPEVLKQNQKKKRVLGLGIGAVVAVLVLIIGLASYMQTPAEIIEVEPSPSPTPALSAARTGLLGKLDVLRENLEAADPTKSNLLFPGVDLDIRLEPAKRQ